jgi:putative sugar O-methyltransferase
MSEQVIDDPELFELMLQDRRSVLDLYKPSNYWLNYEKLLLPELRREGLRDFRRRKNSVLTSFGATDLTPASLSIFSLPIWPMPGIRVKVYHRLSYCYNRLAYRSIHKSRYNAAKEYGNSNGAQSIHGLEASTVGSPEDVFSINGKLYTTSLLDSYVHYAYCCKYLDFNTIDTIMEIGAGAGKQIEVIKKLHPDITFYVFEIPPQLYVCEQYLSALFPDSVISYRQTRTMKEVPEEQAGKIFIFGNWKISQLAGITYDLFWNSASFQEMEPNIVTNYLGYVNQQTKKYAYLFEMMEGQQRATSEGSQGVLEPTTFEHYKVGLKDFELQDKSKGVVSKESRDYSSSFWRRKTRM